MTANKQIIRRIFEEGMNERRYDVFDELVDPTYVNHDMPAPVPGAAGLRQVIQMFVQAFPDIQIRIHEVLEDGDLVATRGEMLGTHQGEFMGIPTTGKSVSVAYIDIWRVNRGRAVENWVKLDMLGLMQQLGVIPTATAG